MLRRFNIVSNNTDSNNENNNENMDENMDENKDLNENIEDYKERVKDMVDVNILTTQSNAQLVLALGYFLEYKASIQALELIKLKYDKKAYDQSIGIEEEEEEDEFTWKNAGIDADKTALLAAEIELYGQTILARLDYIKLQNLSENYGQRDFTLAKSANIEIYIGAMLEEIAYIFNLEGAKKLFAISNENPMYDE